MGFRIRGTRPFVWYGNCGRGLFFDNLVVVLVVLSHELRQVGELDLLLQRGLAQAGVSKWLTDCERQNSQNNRESGCSVENAISC